MTKKQLIEMLKYYADDARIITEQNRSIIHISNLRDGTIIFSTTKPIGICNKTGGYVFKNNGAIYAGISLELNKYVDEHEFTRIDNN